MREIPELPYEIWKDRINNELKNIKTLEVLAENSILREENSVAFSIKIKALGFTKIQGELKPKKIHSIFLKLNRQFPYPGGIDFSWTSDIFHPNIHSVENSSRIPGTGYICLNVLKKWSRLSDLETTVKALITLIKHPNPDDPLNYPICLEAAEFFKKKSMEDLEKDFGFEETEDEKKESEEDIIIIDD
ncbi:MAG: ubiquitin-conjugating enzyme E2 [Promethearchaeota archaeon]